MRYPNKWNRVAEPIAIAMWKILKARSDDDLKVLAECDTKLHGTNCLSFTHDCRSAIAALAREEIRGRDCDELRRREETA